MIFDLSYAPMDLSSTLRRTVALATGVGDYDSATGDPVDPADVRMGKVFAIHDLVAVVAGVVYIGVFSADADGNGNPGVHWYDPATGVEAADHVDFSTWANFPVEVVGQ